MEALQTDQALQIISWIFALTELITGLYIFALSPRLTANRTSSLLIVLIAVHSYASGMLLRATGPDQTLLPTAILATTAPSISPIVLLVAIARLKSMWLKNQMRWLWQTIAVFPLLITLLTCVDFVYKTNIWFTRLNLDNYSSGYVLLSTYTQGTLSSILRTVSFSIFPILLIGCLFYIAFLDRRTTGKNRSLARLLLVSYLLPLILYTPIFSAITPLIKTILFGASIAFAMAAIAFQLQFSEGRAQSGSLQTHLTSISLVSTIPIMIALAAFITGQAKALLVRQNITNLRIQNSALASSIENWIEANTKLLQLIASQPEIISMQGEHQIPILTEITTLYPYINLVSTTDLGGKNIARSDGLALENYNSQRWFQEALSGRPIYFQITQLPGVNGPVLISAIPLHDKAGAIVGTIMFTSLLEDIRSQLDPKYGAYQGTYFVIDLEDQVIFHAERQYILQITSFRQDRAVNFLRKYFNNDQSSRSNSSLEEPLRYEDPNGIVWRVIGDELSNGWLVVSQIPDSILSEPVSAFQSIVAVVIFISALSLGLLSWATIRQAIKPIKALTVTAEQITSGDLTQVAPVETDDELGALARAFNKMTGQLREGITELENRVTQRTHALERRIDHVQLAVEVAREATSILDVNALIQYITTLVSDRFGYYQVGIFLIDDAGKYVILQSSSSEGGKELLSRKFKLPIGEIGIVGHVAATGEARIVLDVSNDISYVENPMLPETHAEMALPLRGRGRIFGVLDIQSKKQGVFVEEDIVILQLLADQIALEIENARLYKQSQVTLEQLKVVLQQQIASAWKRIVQNKAISFYYDGLDVQSADSLGDVLCNSPIDSHALRMPIELHGQTIGYLDLRRDGSKKSWTADDVTIIKTGLAQVALTLENARLQAANQRRLELERHIGLISSKAENILDVDGILQIVTHEIGHTLGDAKVRIYLKADDTSIVNSMNDSGDMKHG